MKLNKSTLIRGIKNFLKSQSSLIALVVLIIVASFIHDKFLTALNLTNMLRQASMIGLVSVGITFVILTGGIDLSVGAIVALSAMVTTLAAGMPIIVILLVPIAVGAIIGLINGIMVARLKVQAFISTLSMMLFARGLAFVISDGKSVKGVFPAVIKQAARADIIGIPIYGLIFAVIVIIAMVVLNYTSLGKKVYAVGGNEEAAKMMGIKTESITTLVYIISGILSGLAGLLISLRMGSALAYTAQGWELTAIASVVIGGTLLTGGIGKISGTFYGVMILQVIANSINLQGTLEYWYVWFITGILLLAIILFQKRISY